MMMMHKTNKNPVIDKLLTTSIQMSDDMFYSSAGMIYHSNKSLNQENGRYMKFPAESSFDVV